jgi:oligopeptide/dipeptide ABC transporter ATP-binding protein
MSAPATGGCLLDVDDLRVHFGRRAHPVRAVDGVSLAVAPGEAVGLVGESGCGKTTLGRAILGLEPASGGSVRFRGEDVTALRGRALKDFRRRVQMVFQDPMGSLNPRLTVGGALEEVLVVHRVGAPAARRERAGELLALVGLDPAYRRRYPHEFSGGQRQRIGLARALALSPELVIADEPVSALDVSVQVQILNLMKDLQERLGLAYLFIAHDLAAVRYVASRVLVMYLGRIVEAGPVDDIYRSPAHPYTAALLAAVPDVERGLAARAAGAPERRSLPGDVSPADASRTGCPFHPRCPRAEARCRGEAPALRAVAADRRAACHFAEELAGGAMGGRS